MEAKSSERMATSDDDVGASISEDDDSLTVVDETSSLSAEVGTGDMTDGEIASSELSDSAGDAPSRGRVLIERED